VAKAAAAAASPLPWQVRILTRNMHASDNRKTQHFRQGGRCCKTLCRGTAKISALSGQVLLGDQAVQPALVPLKVLKNPLQAQARAAQACQVWAPTCQAWAPTSAKCGPQPAQCGPQPLPDAGAW